MLKITASRVFMERLYNLALSDMSRRAVNKERIERDFEESGERDRLREILTLRLSECGWTSLVEDKCREFIRKKGIENVTLEQVVGEIKQDARKAVPDEVKREIMDAIRIFVSKQVRPVSRE
uniref:Transcription and mRNA export factor ENY2 n=1 Tax=Steinernema glaseri TaxID=37863 RepID=A0A1I7ZWK9_9BILA